MTCAHCEELKAEVAFLKSELALDTDEARLGAVMRGSGLGPQTSRVLLFLHTRAGRFVGSAAIEEAMPEAHFAGRQSPTTVRVQIMRVRKALGDEGVETLWGTGSYRMTRKGKAVVDRWLGALVTVRRAA